VLQVEALIRHYLRIEPSENMVEFLRQYVAALWIEERSMNVMAAAIAKALGGKEGV